MKGIRYLSVVILTCFAASGFSQTLHMVLEPDSDPAGLYLATFDSIDYFESGIASSAGFINNKIGVGYSLKGFTFDGKYRMLLEPDSDPAGLYLATFDTIDDFKSGVASSAGFINNQIGTGYSVGGFTFDGQYRMLLEPDSDPAGLYLATFDTIGDFESGIASSAGFINNQIGSGYSVGGFANQPVPEPGTILALSLGGLALLRRQKRA